ncbi:hypothetical protein HZA87_01905 [Candidatus Uhrbacteria bacterium]|nr:hypothetical protein [Candidatus Uhrbacteria bacterium]
MDELFARLGLNEKETETFRTLLSLGAQPVSVIAKHVHLPRSSMYFIVEKLKEHRLIEEFERTGIRYVKCIPVRDLPDVVKAQQRGMQQTLELLREKLPQLQALENTLTVTPKVKLSEGMDAVMKVYESLAHEKQIYSYFNPAVFMKMMPAYATFISDAVIPAGGKAKEIVVDCKEARAYKKKFHSKNHQYRLLPAGVTFLSDCIICKDRVCFVTYGEKQIAAIELFSTTLAATQRVIFDQMWKSLE